VLSLQDVHNEVLARKEESSQDYVLKKYLKKLFKYTGRATILYASAFTLKEVSGRVLQINRQDSSYFMAASSAMEGQELDLIVHSPGGSVEATEQIVAYLRRRYDHIRVIVPLSALSTATLLCCAADRIVIGGHSSLGPFDPVVNWSYQGAAYSAAAQNIIDEFAIAQRNINNKRNNPILWIEKLKAYPPGLLATCKTQIQLSRTLAKSWLEKYMFANEEGAAQKAEDISAWLGDSRNFASSVRPIGYNQANSQGLKLDLLSEEATFEENLMAVYYAAMTKLQTSDCVKIVVNHLGKGCTVGARSSAGLKTES
jgi:ATP-dependent protease ClpP protease subunit